MTNEPAEPKCHKRDRQAETRLQQFQFFRTHSQSSPKRDPTSELTEAIFKSAIGNRQCHRSGPTSCSAADAGTKNTCVLVQNSSSRCSVRGPRKQALAAYGPGTSHTGTLNS